MKFVSLFLIIFIMYPICNGGESLISVKFGIADTLYKEDDTPCGNYKESITAAINYGIGESSKKLINCGYKLDYIPYYFNIEDALSARDAGKVLSSKNVWFVIGPRRSDLFILTIDGLQETPAISLMAGSNKVSALVPPIFTMYPNVKKLAQAAFIIARNERLGKSYGAFVDAMCSACKDFDSAFDVIAEGKIRKKFTLDGTGNQPNLDHLFYLLKLNQIDFLLLPNYSRFSGYVMWKVHEIYPNIKFLGSDGWGEDAYSFIPDFNLSSSLIGYCVRLGTESNRLADRYKIYSLDREWNEEIIKPSVTTYSAIQLIRNMANLLCESKAKNKKEFLAYLSKQNKYIFHSEIDISAFKIINSKPKFYKSLINEKKHIIKEAV